MGLGNGASEECHGKPALICRAGVGLSFLSADHSRRSGITNFNVTGDAGSGLGIPWQINAHKADKYKNTMYTQ